MSLQVWLPLNGNLNNQGLANIPNLTISSCEWINGKIGKCIKIPKVNTNTISISELNGCKQFSFSCWIYLDTSLINTSYTRIFSLGHNSDGENGYIRIETIPTNGNFQIIYNKSASHGSSTVTYYGITGGATNAAADKWLHITVTNDGNKISTYFNGEFKYAWNCSSIYDEGYLNGNFYLGGSYVNINDVRIYDHCLSKKEVKEISKGLCLHYKLSNILCNNIAKASTNTTFGSSAELKSITFSGWDAYAQNNLDLTATEWADMVGKQITYRCWINNVEQTKGTGTGIMLHFRYADGTYQQFGGGKNATVGSYFSQGESGWAQLTVTVPDPSKRTNPTTINYVQFSIRHNSSDGAGTCQYQYAKVEKGSIVTAWCPNKSDSIYSQMGFNSNIEYDCSGFGNNGTIVGDIKTVTESARYSNCYNIVSGSGIKNNNFLIGNEWTYSIWFKYPSQDSTGWKSLMLLNSNGGDTDIQLGGYINCSGNTIQYSSNGKYTTGVTFEYNKWNNVVGTYDGTTLKCYLNGVYKTSLTPNQTLSRSNLVIGARSTATDASTIGAALANGFLSDARIYATALSADDVKELYEVGAHIDNHGNIYGYEFVEG